MDSKLEDADFTEDFSFSDNLFADAEPEDVEMAFGNDKKVENDIEDIDRAYMAGVVNKGDAALNEVNLKLINLIKQHPCLYDRSHAKYEDPTQKSISWASIASQMNKKRSDVKKKFASLYQLFGNIYYMLRDPELAGEGFPKTEFSLYKDMYFLKDHIDVEKAKKRISNIVKNSKLPPDQQQKLKQQQILQQKQMQQQKQLQQQKLQQQMKKPAAEKPKMVKGLPSQRLQPYQRFPATRPPMMRGNMPGPSQFFPRPNSFPPSGRSPMFNPRNPPMDMGFQGGRSPPPMMDNRGSFNGNFRDERDDFDDAPDECHVDFFFQGIAQQVKNCNISDRSFLDLQSTILTALTCKLSNYHQ